MIKYYTHQTPPPVLAEPESKLPDECRQSDFVPLPTLLERFIVSGAHYTEYMGAQGLSAEEKESLFESQDVEDILEDDLSVQKAFADSVLNQVVQQQDKKEKEPTQPEKQDEPEKPETAENA